MPKAPKAPHDPKQERSSCEPPYLEEEINANTNNIMQ